MWEEVVAGVGEVVAGVGEVVAGVGGLVAVVGEVLSVWFGRGGCLCVRDGWQVR